METMTAHDAELRYPQASTSLPRKAWGATVVTGLYVLLVLAAPWIVRYAPDTGVRPLAVAAVGKLAMPSPCVSAPEYGKSCATIVAAPESAAPAPAH